jgi:hypothetical protein
VRTTATTERLDTRGILDALRLLVAPGTVTELRALLVKVTSHRRAVTIAGFFDHDHLEQMAREAVKLTRNAKGVYLVLNPLTPDLLARCKNRVEEAETGVLAADKDVLCRRWLYIDVDPKRLSGISATDAEKAAAHEVVTAIRCYLESRGWPAPFESDSGNGYHLLYRIDLPADDRLAKQLFRVEWLGTVDSNADDVLGEAAKHNRGPGKVEQAAEWLVKLLEQFAYPSDEIVSAAHTAGFSRDTIFRAKRKLDGQVRASNKGRLGRVWHWGLGDPDSWTVRPSPDAQTLRPSDAQTLRLSDATADEAMADTILRAPRFPG